MKTFGREYTTLFNSVTDAIEKLQQVQEDLIRSQQEAEGIYIAAGEDHGARNADERADSEDSQSQTACCGCPEGR